MGDEIARAKRALRARMAESRRLHPEREAERASAAIAAAVVTLPEFAEARHVGLYSALHGEPDLGAVLDTLWASARRPALPRCRPDGGLDFLAISRWEDLEPGRYGLLEPSSAFEPDPGNAIDLVVVPGVAFDRAGRRLGRGKGYYDRALSEAQRSAVLRVGVAFAFQLEPEVPAGPLDQRMDVVVTELGVIRCTEGDRAKHGGSARASWTDQED